MVLFDEAKLSQYMFEEVGDLDLSSLYPSIIMALNLAPETFILKINILSVDKDTNETIYIEDIMLDEYISGDYVNLGNKYLDLPNLDDILSEIA